MVKKRSVKFFVKLFILKGKKEFLMIIYILFVMILFLFKAFAGKRALITRRNKIVFRDLNPELLDY